MYHSGYHELVRHQTGGFPLAYYRVDHTFPRYHMTMHWHDEVEFIRILEGELRLFLNDKEYILHKGDFCMVGSGTIHGGEPEDCVYECVVFDLRALTPPANPCAVIVNNMLYESIVLKNSVISDINEMQGDIESVFHYASLFNGEVLHLLACVFNVLHHLSYNNEEKSFKTEINHNARRSTQLKPALEYIEKNYSQHITLEQLASLSGFSPKYFCRYFQSYVHRSPIDYLNYYRIERGAEFLLKSADNVAEVAMKCGFADSSAFIKQFKRYKGTTPKQYQLHETEEK